MSHEAIRIAHPEAVSICGYYPDVQVWDKNGQEIQLDIGKVDAAIIQMQVDYEAKELATINAKQSALNKLMALGLTEEEALALGVK